jgi:hypothetical protein
MRHCAKLLAAAAFAAAFAAPAAAQVADMRPVDRSAVLAAFPACQGLPGALDAAAANRTAAGWTATTMARPANMPEPLPLRMLMKDNVLMILAPAQGGGVACTLMARVSRSVRTPGLIHDVAQALGREPSDQSGNRATWRYEDGRAVQLTHHSGEAPEIPGVAVLFVGFSVRPTP